MENIDFGSNDALQPESSQNATSRRGLTLVLPPLSAVKALKGKKKGYRGVGFQDAGVQKTPRPTKLKPLKEVLSKLIIQIKKKDDYAFFLTPVNPSQVPGYSDVIKRPMDFGSMTVKVQKGKYRSLEEFATDVRLVTTNAKLFNPPGTIYHSEAERIEMYAIDHINKAAANVIEYETDWNIDIEHDDNGLARLDDDDERSRDAGTPMDVDGSTRGRSPSVASTQTPLNGHLPRRGGKGSSKKQPGMLSESLEPGGHLPGYKDGVGLFPSDSNWAALMLSLKLKGKRYRTKKERIRMEKGGPPYSADGSLAYTEMEDPFSVLSVYLSDPPSKPAVTSLYRCSDSDFPGPVNLPLDRPLPQTPSSILTKRDPSRLKTKRRHWNIIRNAPTRRGKDRDVDEEDIPSWKVPREPHAVDYGTFAALSGQLAQEYRIQDVGKDLGSEPQTFGAIRRFLEHAITWRHPSYGDDDMDLSDQGYWVRRGRQAEDYLRDVVYGGVDGLAYVRSVAEFTSPPQAQESLRKPSASTVLGKPLAHYVEETIIDPLTDGRHCILRETARWLYDPHAAVSPTTSSQLDFSLHRLPSAARHLVELRKIATHQLDMAALIHAPEELFLADNEWAGKAWAEQERRRIEAEQERALAEASTKNAMQYLAAAVQSHEEAQAGEGAQKETRGMLRYALEHSANLLAELTRKDNLKDIVMTDVKNESNAGSSSEDPVLRELRLNLLALAKRAPLDKIARLPADLVPEPIRHIVPTIEST